MRHSTFFKSLLLLCALMAVGGNICWAADKWVKTDATALQTGDIVAIVDQTSARAMSNNNGTSKAPAATAVTLNDDKSEITGDVAETLQWVVTVTTDDAGGRTYQFQVAETETYLYCINSNNGVRVGTNANNAFTIVVDKNNNQADFLYNKATTRYLGVNSNTDWRCYTSINSNIKDCVTAFYKKTADSDEPAAYDITVSDVTMYVGQTKMGAGGKVRG